MQRPEKETRIANHQERKLHKLGVVTDCAGVHNQDALGGEKEDSSKERQMRVTRHDGSTQEAIVASARTRNTKETQKGGKLTNELETYMAERCFHS
eukprot:g25735.t1